MNPFALPSGRISGDAFPTFRDGQCHLFHMMPPVIAHHVSRDLVNWEERPVVVAPGGPDKPDSSNNATGSVVEHDGRFHLFYTGNQNVCLAVSADLDHWEKHPRNPVLQGDGAHYGTENFRDPYVFRYEPEGCWWMLFGAQIPDSTPQRAGCVGLAKSRDLLSWELCPPLWSPQIGPHTDCPQLINHQDKWWLFYLQRNTRYRVADGPVGPFQRPPARNLGSLLAAAGSRPAWDGQRWISIPFVTRLAGERDDGGWEYGGPLAIPRELEFHADGTITERPAAEILTAIRQLPEPGDVWANAQRLADGTWLLPALSADVYLEFDLTLDSADMDFHLLLRTEPTLQRGYQLALHPRTSQVSFRRISQWDCDRVLVSRSVPLPVGRPMSVRLFLSGSICEVFLDDRYSLTARCYQHRTGQIGFEFRDGPRVVSQLVWRPLIPATN